MEQMKETNTQNKFNWKLVIIAILIMFIIFMGLTYLRNQGAFKSRGTIYCYFNNTLNESVLPRNECGIIKVVSYEIDRIDLDKFAKLEYATQCSKKLSDLPPCDGDIYNYLERPLHNYCDFTLCDVDGVLCAAYSITYHSNYSNWRQAYEEDFFTKANITQEEMNNLFTECDANG